MARDLRVLGTPPSVALSIARAAATSFGRPGAEAGLPDRSALLPDVRQDAERLAAYNRLTGYALRSRVPATWLHVLTFPLHAYLMAEKDFPFPLAGVVHVTNDMTLHRPVEVTDRLRIRVHADNLTPHKRGVAFDLLGEVHVDDELAWSGTSNYLALGARLDGEPAEPPFRLERPEVPASQQWRLPADLGRRYAHVSGDTNPIHLHPLTARPFGFKRPIIHGMWTYARSIAAIEPQLPEAYRARVSFTKPLSLPGRARFAVDREGDAWRYAVLNSDESKPYLLGDVAPA